MNNVLSSHFPQAENDSLWEVKQDMFFRIFSQVDNIHQDRAIPMTLKNISLYLETDADIKYKETSFEGLSKTEEYNLSIKEYVKYDDDNWVIFIDLYNRIEFNEDGEATDLNIENPFAQLKKFSIGCMDSTIFIAPGGSERVISISDDFKMRKLGISIDLIKNYMCKMPLTDGYKVNEFDTGVYLLDSPAPLFAKDSVEYRDGDYVGLWLSFGTLLKYDLRDLNVFNIDGVQVGGIDSDVKSNSVKILKMLTNTAYGYASIVFNRKNLLEHLMKYSKRYIYETNSQDETRVCVDNLLFNLTNTGIFGLLYDEFESVEEFPMFAYDETTVQVVKKRGTVIKFKYKKDYIYMMLDLENSKMYFMSYHGRIGDYYNQTFNYNVKIMNDLWVSKVNDISQENFILFTGFPNLKHNKVLDMYFDNTTESFSSLDKQFAIDVNEFDSFFEDTVENPSAYSYDKKTDFIHAYGNNPIPITTGLLTYMPVLKELYALETHVLPDIKTFIDAKNKKVLIFEPVVSANGHINKSLSELKVVAFINNYVSRKKNGEDSSEWITEAEDGGYVWSLYLKYFSTGWTFYKHDNDTYRCVKLPTVKKSVSYEGSIVDDCIRESEAVLGNIPSVGGHVTDIQQSILEGAKNVLQNYEIEIKQIEMAFSMQMFSKMSLDTNIIDPEYAVFEFKRFEGSDDMFINNDPTGPFANHAVLFEDTFNYLVSQTPDVYDSLMSYTDENESFYCPYLFEFTTASSDGNIRVRPTSDLSTSRRIYRNKRTGLAVYKADKSRSENIAVGSITMTEREIYRFYSRFSYFGIRKLVDKDFHIFKLENRLQFSKAFIEALTPELNNKLTEDWAEFDGAKQKYDELNEASLAKNIDMESSQPLYVALLNNKLKVSLDGKTFIDAPLGGKEIELSSTFIIEDRVLFIKTLNTLLYQRKNSIDVNMVDTYKHVETDIYSIAVEDIFIDTSLILSDGIAKVSAMFSIDNGQAVLGSTNLIYSVGETFSIEKTIEIDGFKRIDPEDGDFGTVKVLIPFSFKYHTLVPTRNEMIFDTASELKLHSSSYEVTMNLPMFVSIQANEYYYIDKDEAQEDGVETWFNFTGE